MTDTFDEGSVFTVHDPVRGAVLIIGVGTVGSSLAMQLGRLGITLRLIDKDILKRHNLVRHQLDETHRGHPKTELADEIKRRMSWMRDKVDGVYANFMELPPEQRRRYIDEADVVVAATDEAPVQRFINQECIEARKTVVFPGVWVDPDGGEPEAGEVLWVNPRRRMPCYECVTTYRHEAQDARAGRGAQADIDSIVLATVLVVRGLLQPGSRHAEILEPERQNLILVHGFMPPSRQVGEVFEGRALVHVQVPFPRSPCPACGRHARRTAARTGREPATREAQAEWPRERLPGRVLSLFTNLIIDTVVVVVWPFILFYPVAFVAAFGPDNQQFLGPVHENVVKLQPPFIVATIVMIACAALVNLWRFLAGSTARALAGWEVIPPVCFLLSIPAVFVAAIGGNLISLVVRTPGVDFTRYTPLSPLMIWGAALTPAALLLTFEIIGVHRFRRHGPAWVVCAATMAVFGLLTFFSGHAGAPATSVAAGTPSVHPSQAKPTASSSQPIPPTHIHLVCDVSQTSSYAHDGSDCASHNMYSGDAIALKVSGLTQHVVRVLCRRGFRGKWSSTIGDGGNYGMCEALRDDIFSSDGKLLANFTNPEKLGKVTVTWRLISPADHTVLTAKYSFRVVETLTQSLVPPPS